MPREDTQFKPGESGNPDGKPKGSKDFTTVVREALKAVWKGKATSAETALVESILENAISRGKTETQKLIWNYLDGMPVAKTEHSGEIKTTPNIAASPALIQIAQEYEERILQELKKTNKDNQ